ncbi:hypothetical protein FIV42_24010 [Persicimonas caeni]|uniref:Uncharacterized protein n=1 Tax=Persicimonas caeni TaxID=2292766 RepID=A0A4Y6PZE6_PERCE|nr:hypothetical protein [Persicimonas caeni]QDG53696.1 hypothetical protein FIV42_24010 [Persicimonas caeni]QED34917.1 hypothetical protein FRD00_24005 [Persicimonas caeni]
MRQLQFTSWYPLDRPGVDAHAPEGPAAVQIRVEEGLVDYPSGRSSAMVCYFYASENARETLEELFGDEIDQPGARGQGPLLFRFIEGRDRPLHHLKKLLYKFHTQFDAFPLFNQKDED